MKTIFLEQLKEGDRFEEIFLVKSARLGETRAGKPYMVLTVMDRSGDLSGPVWDNAEHMAGICRPGVFVKIRGMVSSYRDNLQLRIDNLEAVPKEAVDLSDFVEASRHNIDEMSGDLQKIIRSLDNPYLKKLLLLFFDKDEVWQRFRTAPAAKGIHHAYVGGLLEHALSMARVADMLADHYEGVDRSLVIAGALLHDVGKVEELFVDNGVIDYSARGRLKGHLVIGSEMVGRAAARIKDFPEDLLTALQHLILSHHGRLEFGSPVLPMTVEAFLLQYIDELDSRMNMLEQLRRKLDSEEMSWTDYQRTLERYLYLNMLKEERKEERKQEALDASARQQSLF